MIEPNEVIRQYLAEWSATHEAYGLLGPNVKTTQRIVKKGKQQ